uniref:Ionotropic glutamate receptor C-terminal domain-containing protein n=1 Tax=Schizaphis graminum TaxID=13262 RepID=A0A2S2P2H2_SCHGA
MCFSNAMRIYQILEPNSFHGWDKPILTHNLDAFAHMHYAICKVLAEQLNFTLNLTVSSDYGWNYGNGTYSGLIGQLQREEIEFTAAGALMRSDRMDVGDLTVGTFVARTVAIYKQPPLSSVNNIFTLPFVPNVWKVMFVVMSAFAVALIFLTWTSNWLHGIEMKFSIVLDTVILVFAAICQQGLSVAAAHSIPTRIATFTLFLCAVFLFTSYAACIVVLLQSASRTINTIADLADKPITFSAQDTRHNYIYFNV